jgi:hypothetical protein
MEDQPPSSPGTCRVTAFFVRPASRTNMVSSIPSGPVMFSLTTTSRVVPATASTTRPSQSVLIP